MSEYDGNKVLVLIITHCLTPYTMSVITIFIVLPLIH